ncbi:single-stranded DNA-binding protein [Bifidobacterium aquikefiri]|uniref:single-stranded DNA-binding protein n=1 Tax=Bifidobacterium aquikefiri TaxID=1653207 RepID=UPI0039EC27E9
MAKIQFYGQLQAGRNGSPAVDVRQTNQGKSYARIDLREIGKKKDGSNWFGTFWHTTIWDETLVNLSANFQPGDVLQVTGELSVKWDKDRQKEYRDVNLNSGARIEKKSHVNLVQKQPASPHNDGFLGISDPWANGNPPASDFGGGNNGEPEF